MVLRQVLLHIVQLVKIPHGTLLVVHDDLLVLLDALDNLLRLALEARVHALHVVALHLLGQQVKESFLLGLQVDRIGALAHGTWRVLAKAKEVAEGTTRLLLLVDSSLL